MAGRGPAPQAERSRENDTARRQSEIRTLAWDGQVRGPELPGEEWHPRTLAWWSSWRRSPQAVEWTDADWDFLLDTALLHQALWGDGDVKVAAELRLRVAKFGATPEDRMRLRMSVGAPEKPTAPSTPSARRAVKDRKARVNLEIVKG